MRVVAFLVAVALSGCSTTVPFPLASDTTVHVQVLGDPGQECVIEPSSDAHGKLKYWLAENRTGWSQLYYTRPSAGVLLSTREIQLQTLRGYRIYHRRAGRSLKARHGV
jgi:hypothetical protein